MDLISEQELLRKYIAPSHHVIVVGPHLSMDRDPSLADICTFVDPDAGGRVTIVDNKYYGSSKDYRRLCAFLEKKGVGKELLEEIGRPGWGNPGRHRKSLLAFGREHKIRMVKPGVWFANVFKTGLPRGSAHSILSRGTQSYAMRVLLTHVGWGEKPEEAILAEGVRPMVNEVHRLLKPEGRAIFMFEPTERNLSEYFEAAFREKGMAVLKQELKLSRSLKGWVAPENPQFRGATDPYKIGCEVIHGSRWYDHALVAIKPRGNKTL